MFPPRSFTRRRATRNAAASPSTANETPASEGLESRTKVINGCTEPTAIPCSRSAASSSLLSAPLECSATRFLDPSLSLALDPDFDPAFDAIFVATFVPSFFARNLAALAISASGTQNQMTSARRPSGGSLQTCAPTLRAKLRAFLNDSALDREMIAPISYPAFRNETARTVARFPAPTIAILGRMSMPGSIAVPASGSLPAPGCRLSAFGRPTVPMVKRRSGSRKPRAGSRQPEPAVCFILFLWPNLLLARKLPRNVPA